MKANVLAAILVVALARDNSEDEEVDVEEWTVTGSGFTMDGVAGEWMGKDFYDEGEWSHDHWFWFKTSGANMPSDRWVVNWVEWDNTFMPGTISSFTCAAKFVVNATGPANEYMVTNWTGSFTSGDATVSTTTLPDQAAYQPQEEDPLERDSVTTDLVGSSGNPSSWTGSQDCGGWAMQWCEECDELNANYFTLKAMTAPQWKFSSGFKICEDSACSGDAIHSGSTSSDIEYTFHSWERIDGSGASSLFAAATTFAAILMF